MSDYTKATDFASKDTLPTGNPAKIVKGTEIGAEFDAIATAVATKVDQVGDGIDLTGKTVSLDITDLTLETTVDNANDLVAIYDASALAHRKVDVDDLINAWGADRTITAGTGLSGGGALNGNISLATSFDELTTETALVDADFIVCRDADGAHDAKITLANFVTTLEGDISHDNLVGVAANEHIDHTTVSISAGTGLTGGGTIAANRSLSIDTHVLRHNNASLNGQVYVSTSSPSGGSNGDIWLKY